MRLRFDALLVRHLARELDRRLAGARLRALRLDGTSRELVVLFREATLTWRLHPDHGAPLLLPPAEPGDRDLPLPSRVRAVHAPADERVVVFELVPARGRGPRTLVVELLGNQWNALVVEGPDARIRHVLVRRGPPRPARVGTAYEPPSPSAREGASDPLSLERWLGLLAPVPPEGRARALVASVAWTSPLVARALLEGDADPDAALRSGHALWTRMAFGPGEPSPALLETPRGLQPYPFPVPGVSARPFPTLLEALRAWSDERAPGAARAAAGVVLPPELVAAAERALDGALRRVTRLEGELAGLEDEGALRAMGDLLLARFTEVPPGAREAPLTDFGGARVVVPLDPALPVQENARRLYERAARVRRARERLPGLAAAARAEAAALEDVVSRARAGEATTDEVRAHLPAGPVGRAPGEGAPALPYRSYRSSGGLEIRVGRGARHNDDLTFHHAAPDDIWLHARHAAGAHVVLRWGRPGSPPARDLREAAVLAALHSRARTSGVVPVDWTRRKHIRKPRGSAPGAVSPQQVKTVFVEPDPALADALAEGGGGVG